MSKCVSPVNMCEICCEEFIWNNNENQFKCWSSQRHLICKDCCKKESERRQEKGFNNPNECILCKPFQEKVEYYTVNINQPVTIEITDTRNDNKSATTYSIFAVMLLILIGSIFWNISVVVSLIPKSDAISINFLRIEDAATKPSINKIKWSPLDFDLNGTSGYFLFRIIDITS